MKIDMTGRVLLDMDGKELLDGGKPMTLARAVARMLLESQEKSDPVKLFEMAMRIVKDPVLEVDSSDYELLEKVIASSAFIPLAKGQVLLMLRGLKG